MSYMRDANNRRLDTIAIPSDTEVATMIDQVVDPVADLIAGQFPSPDERRLYGPVTVDLPTVNLNVTPSPSTYNQAYAISGGALPADWPVDTGDAPVTIASNFVTYTSGGGTAALQPWRYRFMCDATRVVILMNSGAGSTFVWGDFFLYVDGAPVSLTKYDPPTGSTYTELVFADARPRLIEVLTCAPLNGVFVPKPYRCWKPPTPPGVKALLVGDSYSAGVTIIGGTLGSPTLGDNIQGFSSQLGLELGIGRWSTDGIGGTGFISRNINNNNYNDRRAEHITRAPDALIVMCSGNDLYHGSSVADIVTAATTYFTQVRAALPNCKLIFMEGFTPAFWSTYGANYISIRSQLQTALAAVGVYYIDIATSSAWLDGTGYVGATTGVGNSDIYVGNDSLHLSPAGTKYIQKRLAPKLKTCLADDGSLVNTLL